MRVLVTYIAERCLDLISHRVLWGVKEGFSVFHHVPQEVDYELEISMQEIYPRMLLKSVPIVGEASRIRERRSCSVSKASAGPTVDPEAPTVVLS